MARSEPDSPKRQDLQTLRRKIVLYAVVYTLLALLIISLLTTIPLFNRLKRSEETNLLHSALIRSVAIEEYLNRVTGIARQVSTQMLLRRPLIAYYREQINRQELSAFTSPKLLEAVQNSETLAGITRVGRQGEILAQVGIPIPEPLWPPFPESGQPVLSDPQVIGNRLYLLLAVPVAEDGVVWLGTDIFLFSTTHLQRIVWNPETMREEADAFLGRELEDGAEIFFPGRLEEREVYKSATRYPLYRLALQKALQGESGILHPPDSQRGDSGIVAFAPVGETGWGLLVTMDQAALYADVNRLLLSILGAVFILTLAAAFGMLFLLRPLAGQALVYSFELEQLNRELQQEIAERKRVAENLRRSEREWSQTFEAITDAVAILDTEGNVLRMNKANASFLAGLSPGALKERRCKVHFGLERSDQPCPFTQMLKSGAPEFGELYEPQQDLFYHISVYPLVDEQGKVWGGVHIAQNVTEQRKMEFLKDEMISAVSHEMRTPLTAMLGFVEYLLENPVAPEQQRDFLQTVHRETIRLNDLISNFLDLQRLQAQLENYHLEPLVIPDLLQEAAHLFAVASRRHRIEIDFSPDLPPVLGDAKRLHQVMKNLLSNAIKYSPEGGTITVGARREAKMVRIWVRDEGMGIPPQALGKIFDRFYRVDDSSRRIPGGIGLGLALVREVVRAHGGRIWAESTLGKGSTFYFTLPVAEEGRTEDGGGLRAEDGGQKTAED